MKNSNICSTFLFESFWLLGRVTEAIGYDVGPEGLVVGR